MNVTNNLKLPQYTEEDIFDLQDINKAYDSIDNAYKEVIDFKNEIPKTNATAEVINARGGKETLGKRLDEFGSQLDTIANKGTTVEVLERVTKEEIDRQIQDGTIANLTLADESITLEKLNASIFGVAYILQGVEKTWLSYEFIKLSQKYSNCKLRVKFDYTPNNDTFFRIATNKYNSEVTSIIKLSANVKTTIDKEIELIGTNTFDKIRLETNSSELRSFDGTIENIVIAIDDNNIVNYEVPGPSIGTCEKKVETGVTIASKAYVDNKINEAINGIGKKKFVLPFVNNLYVVQGSERKHSVPIFIDYLYNGQKNKILFENGEDRTYIGETVVRPDTQSKNILNTKTTLKFKSDVYNVKDVTFNKISIEEKVPNGDIRLLIIGDSVTAGAITEKQYWAVASELFALEDIDRKRTSKVMFLGSNNVRNTTINYNGVKKQVKSCACGISSWSLRHWLTNSSSHFVYDNNGTPVFSILKWLERYRTHLDDGTKLELGDSRLGTKITSSNIDNIQCCTPNIVYINSTHNGGSIEEHEQMIEIIRREIPNCKIIVGNPMPLTGTWHKEKYVGIDWLDNGNIIGPNYDWGGGYGTDRIASLNYYIQKERTTDWFYFMPQCVTMPTVEALEYELVDCGIKQMKQVTKVNQLPKEHPGTLTHKIWGYELYALLKYISGVEQGATNNFDTVPLFD